MTREANATYPQKIACLIWLAHESGHPFLCAECGRPILPGQPVQFDHRHAVGRGGQNRVQDLRPVHASKRGTEDAQGNAIDCHDRKTFRPRGGATTLGGDNYEAKKTDRLAEAQQLGSGGAQRVWPSRKIQNRVNPWSAKGSRPLRSHSSFGRRG